MYVSGYGMVSYIQWNYPEAILENNHVYKNTHAYNGQDRTELVSGEFIGNYGNANYTIDNATIEIYGTTTDV